MAAAAPACPACAYDLSGLVESWRSACPLRGVCPECGGPLDWRDVLRPTDRPPPWSFEHAPTPRLRLALFTLMRLTEPLGFYRAMAEARSARPSRVAALLGAVSAGGLLGTLLLALAASRRLAPFAGFHATPLALLSESYGHQSREPIIHLAVWTAAATLALAPFRQRRRGFGRAVQSVLLYTAIPFSLAWTCLAMAALIDIELFFSRGLATGPGEPLTIIVVTGAWLWTLAATFAAARYRLPLRRPLAAALAAQVVAGAALLGFAVLDRWLPF